MLPVQQEMATMNARRQCMEIQATGAAWDAALAQAPSWLELAPPHPLDPCDPSYGLSPCYPNDEE